MGRRALFIGRFQPFHLGHYTLIKQIMKDGYKEIVIGIGSAQASYTKHNPFTAGERIEMIDSALSEEDLKYYLIPIPDIDYNTVWVSHVETLCPRFDVVYSNNKLVRMLFERAGYRVEKEEGRAIVGNTKISGGMIREMIGHGDERWKDLVPEKVYKKILEFDGVRRIKELYSID